MRITPDKPVFLARIIREAAETPFTPEWRKENAVEFEHIVDHAVQIYCTLQLMKAIGKAANIND